MQYFTDLNLFNNSRLWFINSLIVDSVSWYKQMPGYFSQEGQKILPPISSSVFSGHILVLFESGLI
jgi:hypothetical protein